MAANPEREQDVIRPTVINWHRVDIVGMPPKNLTKGKTVLVRVPSEDSWKMISPVDWDHASWFFQSEGQNFLEYIPAKHSVWMYF